MKNSYKVGIVDDEQYGRDFVSLLVANEFPQLDILFRADGVEDAKVKLKKQQPDILFLDIQLGDGTAFDLLAALGGTDAQVIFITAYDHYAIEAIRKDAIDYILKPVRKDDFVAAVEKAMRNIAMKSRGEVFRLTLPTLHGFKMVPVSEIIRCEADSNYTMIYLSDKSKILVSRTLQEFEEQLSTRGFFRIHHKHLVNLEHFKEYIKGKGKGGQVMLSDGTVTDVSVRRKNDFMEQLKNRM